MSASVAKTLRSKGSAAQKLDAVLRADERGAAVLAALERRAQEGRETTVQRSGKFEWSQSWGDLLREERRCSDELVAWMRSHAGMGFPAEDAAAVAVGGAADAPLLHTWGRLAGVHGMSSASQWLDEAGFDRSLLRRGLLHKARRTKGAVGQASEGSSSVVDAGRELEAANDVLWAMKEELYTGEAAAEGEAQEGQAAVWRALHTLAQGVDPDLDCDEAEGEQHVSAGAGVAAEEMLGGARTGRGIESQLDLVGGASCPDGGLRLDLLAGAAALRAAKDDALASLREEYERRCDALGIPPGSYHRIGILGDGGGAAVSTAGALSGLGAGCGGWTKDAHLAYLQVYGKLGAVSAAAGAAAWLTGRSRPGSSNASVSGVGSSAPGARSALRSAGSTAVAAGGAGTSSARPGDSSGGGGGTLASKADTVARLVASLSHAAGRMPGISREQVLLHDTWYAAYRQYSSRAAGRRAQWQREWSAYLESARVAFAQAQRAAADAGERELARREQEQRQRQMHARLLGQRQAAEVEAAVTAEVQRALSEAQTAVAAAHSAAAAAEAHAKKRALDSYHREREAIEARLEANRIAVEELAAQERKAAAAAGSERLAVRRLAEEEQRRTKSEALAAEASRLEADRSAALQRLIASVPYYSRVREIAATSDAGRLVQPTAAFAAASEMSRAYAEFLSEVAMATKADAAALAEAPAGADGARAGGGFDGEPDDDAGDNEGLVGEEGEGDADAEGAGGEGGDGLGELVGGGRARGAGGRGGARSVATRRTHASAASAWSARGSVDLSAAARHAAAAAAGGVPSHLTGAAAAEHAELAARKAAALSRLAHQRASEQGIYARTGFEDKRITRDPRWRAMTALQEAGLQRSQHARQAFAGMQAAGRGATTAHMSGSSAGVTAAFAGDGSGP
jgi:hypothetical protein